MSYEFSHKLNFSKTSVLILIYHSKGEVDTIYTLEEIENWLIEKPNDIVDILTTNIDDPITDELNLNWMTFPEYKECFHEYFSKNILSDVLNKDNYR